MTVGEVATLETLDPDRIARPESLVTAVKRRFAGRYPVDPFGLDPQLADLVTPVFSFAVPVIVEGEQHVPATGPATLVSNRGFGVIEPAALGVAVNRATGRRLRIVGAPSLPVLGSLARRLGGIGASANDVRAALRAGHLVGVPLSPTWLRTSAGMPPHALMAALTHAPIIPAAVSATGPFGTAIGAWRVRFGSLVTLDDPYDPDDPLAAARFADAMRVAVRGLLTMAEAQR
jgi:1-acyl-sn-glycerol-3-phosphate acyltransferase